MAIRALAYNDHLDLAEQLLSRLTPFVTDLDSRQASRLRADLHGTLASTRQDWRDAAHWYGKSVDATEGGLTTWFDLVAAWHLLATRCLCPESADITAAELRDPWQCFQNERIDVLGLLGAVSTAIALHRIGHDDLADSFVSWTHANDPIGLLTEGVFADRLEAAGLPTTAADSGDDLETLIAEVFAVADRLDGIEP